MTKEITVHCIAQTRVNHDEMKSWLRTIGAEQFADDLPYPDSQRYDEQDGVDLSPEQSEHVTDADLLTGVLGKRCYASYEVGKLNPNVTKIRECWADYIDNILKSGHGSVTEHTTWTWGIEGCTRVMTAEANRHRAGVAISEASLRYIRFGADGIPYWLPLSIRPQPYSDDPSPEEFRLEKKREHTRRIFERAFNHDLENYRALEEIWAEELDPTSSFAAKKALTSMFRRIIGMGVSVGVVYTLNVRSLRHVMTMRCSPAAEEEIAFAFGQIAAKMFQSEPRLFGDFQRTVDGFWVPKYVKV